MYGKRSTHEDDDAMSATLAELDEVIGCPAAERRWIPDSSLGWGSDFILSGMEVGTQRRAWRFTPSLPLQMNSITRGSPDNKTKWDPRVLVKELNDSLTLGPLKIDHDARLLEDCVLGFQHGAVLDVFPRASILGEPEAQLPPGVPKNAAPFGIWIVQPLSAPPPSVSCMAGHWHGMDPFEASWPLKPAAASRAKSDDAGATSKTVEQWGRWEQSWPGPSTGNPHVDVALTVEMTSPHVGDPAPTTVRGFYDGDGVFRARFMPPSPGTWRFLTKSNAPQLHGKSGEFVVTPPPAGSNNHGPVVAAPGQTKFAHADGTPFFAVATTVCKRNP